MVELPDPIGRYRVEGVVGSGGFATVYRAYDERLDAVVAVKVLAENHCLDPDLRERFLKEGRVLRRVGSPHLVTVHDLGETDRGQPYLVLDFADRGDLADRARTARSERGWRPGVPDVVHVAGALADALAAVHASHLVHRDVAPRNLLLRSVRGTANGRPCDLVEHDERLLLADLGLSKDLAIASGLTIGGGTAGFTPPEQRSRVGRIDAAADIWAASALVVWLLRGHAPDDHGTWRDELLAAGWSPAVVAVLARGLAPEPHQRHPDIGSWDAALQEALAPPPAVTVPIPPEPTTVTAPTVPSPPSAPPVPSSPGARAGGARPHRGRAVLVLLLAAGLGAALAWAGTRLVDDGAAGQDQTVEELDGDDVRVEATSGDRRVTILGPAEMTVGATARFTAETGGVERSLWIGPDGGVHTDVAELEVSARSPGRATVTLIGVDDQGRRVEATHDLRVVE